MSDSTLSVLPKLAAIATVSLGLNYLITRLLTPKTRHHPRHHKRSETTSRASIQRIDSFTEILND
jgi:hypothetical protein